jgi:hypothetical protein
MRVQTLLLTFVLVAATAGAQQATSSPLNLPISMDKIRSALMQPGPAEPLKGLSVADAPTFHVDVLEQQKFENLFAKIKFDQPGPQVAGGIYAYDQFQRLFPRIDNPLVQPYAAFSTGELITLGVEALVEKYVADKMSHVVGPALREQSEREARDEVARSLAAYRAAQSTPKN